MDQRICVNGVSTACFLAEAGFGVAVVETRSPGEGSSLCAIRQIAGYPRRVRNSRETAALAGKQCKSMSVAPVSHDHLCGFCQASPDQTKPPLGDYS